MAIPQNTSSSSGKAASAPTSRRPTHPLVHPGDMHGHAPAKTGVGDTWVFNAEATSTLLIAAWYVYGVFADLGILPGGGFRTWGNTWIIPMLLGVFYLSAGYLYQRHQRVTSFSDWSAYMKREVIVLLTPFFAFTLLTLLTANVVAATPGIGSSVLASTHAVASAPALTLENFLHAVFVQPVGPVGYFVVLLGFYAITRTPKTKCGMLALLTCAAIAKAAAIILADTGASATLPYYLMQMLDNWLWFVLGQALQCFGLQRCLAATRTAIGAAFLFVAAFATLFAFHITEAAALTLLIALALIALYATAGARFTKGTQDRFYGFVAQYTMAIWLMHQMLASLVFCGLYALDSTVAGADLLTTPTVLAIACLIACYPLPVLVMQALSHIGKLGFIVYPSRYLPTQL